MFKNIKQNIILYICYLLWGIYWFYISYNIPYEADDWNWGSEDGIKQHASHLPENARRIEDGNAQPFV